MQFLNFYKNRKRFYLLFFLVITSFNGYVTKLYAQKKYTVVLDAGHGGKDHGASRGQYKEKKIALRVALDVGKELAKEKDIAIVYTRKTDHFVELHNRAKIANTKKADLFVSIHCNANNSTKPHGSETYVLGLSGNKTNLEIARKENAVILLEDNYKQNYDYDPNSPESLIGLSVLQEENLDLSLAFGGFVQNNFTSLKRYNRKVKQANFLVLRETVMPSVLIELGFLSNKNEGRFLNSRAGQLKMARAIAKAIKKYVTRLRLNTVAAKTETLKEAPKQEKKVPVVKNKKKDVVVKKTVPKKVPQKTVSEKKDTIYFMVQIAAAKQKLGARHFKRLQNVEEKKINNYYKYYCGRTSNLNQAKQTLKKLQKNGFKGAWVVAFKNNKKITIKEALKSK